MLLASPTAMERRADARMGEEDAAEALPGAGDLEGGIVATPRTRPATTPAGHQGQVDFGTFRLPWGPRHALLVVLGYSRLLWLRFYARQTMPVLIEGLENAFCRFGGVSPGAPLRSDAGRGRVGRPLLRWGVGAQCRVSSVRGPLGLRAAVVPSLPGADQGQGGAADPVRAGDVRRHGTTGERPMDPFERDERQALRPLASQTVPTFGRSAAPSGGPAPLGGTDRTGAAASLAGVLGGRPMKAPAGDRRARLRAMLADLKRPERWKPWTASFTKPTAER